MLGGKSDSIYRACDFHLRTDAPQKATRWSTTTTFSWCEKRSVRSGGASARATLLESGTRRSTLRCRGWLGGGGEGRVRIGLFILFFSRSLPSLLTAARGSRRNVCRLLLLHSRLPYLPPLPPPLPPPPPSRSTLRSTNDRPETRRAACAGQRKKSRPRGKPKRRRRHREQQQR